MAISKALLFLLQICFAGPSRTENFPFEFAVVGVKATHLSYLITNENVECVICGVLFCLL